MVILILLAILMIVAVGIVVGFFKRGKKKPGYGFTKGGNTMLSWLSENVATIVVTAVLLALLTTAIVIMVRNKKKGKSSCGCGCSGCMLHDTCQSKKQS